MATISRIGKCTFTSVMNCEYVKRIWDKIDVSGSFHIV